jgi:hypothetical protein
MDPEVIGKTAIGWLWVYARPRGGVIFYFQKGLNREGSDTMFIRKTPSPNLRLNLIIKPIV